MKKMIMIAGILAAPILAEAQGSDALQFNEEAFRVISSIFCCRNVYDFHFGNHETHYGFPA